MPTFLDNSLSDLNRGWQQMYGQPAVGVTPVPVAYNPEVGSPLGSGGKSPPSDFIPNPNWDPRDPRSFPTIPNPNFIPPGTPIMPEQPAPKLPMPAPTPPRPTIPGYPTAIANNPEVGQPLGAGDGGGGGGFNLLGWLQNLLGGGGGPTYSANTNTPANLYSGGASGGGYEAPSGDYYVGASPGAGMSGYIYPSQQAATAAGDVGAGSGGGPGGGMGGAGGMASSVIGGIGNAISSFAKNQPKLEFSPVNIPLPQRAVFAPPQLSPNRNVSY